MASTASVDSAVIALLHQLDLEQFGPVSSRHKQPLSLGIIGDPVQYVGALPILRRSEFFYFGASLRWEFHYWLLRPR
jgi:hypothetical protein